MKTPVLAWLGLGILLMSCGGGGDPGRIVLELSLVGLRDLGPQGGTYEGFAVVQGEAQSTGKFRIDESQIPARVLNEAGTGTFGPVTGAVFGPANTRIGSDFPFIVDASHFFITVEPENDRDRRPSDNVIMAGRIVGSRADLSFTGEIADGVPANADIGAATGRGSLSAQISGTTAMPAPWSEVWFADGVGPLAASSLTLPPTAGAWVYEGWVEIPLVLGPVSTGRFRVPDGADLDALTAKTAGRLGVGPLTPGQAYLVSVALGRAAPRDLVDGDWEAFITVEPDPDDACEPFPLRILEADIPTDAVDPMTGRATREVMLDSAVPDLPELQVQLAPGGLSSSGRAPGALLPAGGDPTLAFYVMWVTVGGVDEPVAAFRVDGAGNAVTSVDGMTVFGTTTSFAFTPGTTGLPFPAVTMASEVFVTLETARDPVGPSIHTVLAGDVTGAAATLTVFGSLSRGLADFAGVEGRFVCLTPTNDAGGVPADDGMGIWFRPLASETAGLLLPVLPLGWSYEGWVENVVTGERWSTGRFVLADAPDDDATRWAGRGQENAGFRVPGQDFVRADVGQPVPATPNLTGARTFITLEPDPDPTSGPSPWIVLDGVLPAVAPGIGPLLANRTASFPTGVLRFDR